MNMAAGYARLGSTPGYAGIPGAAYQPGQDFTVAPRAASISYSTGLDRLDINTSAAPGPLEGAF